MVEQKEMMKGNGVEFEVVSHPLCVIDLIVKADAELVKKAEKEAVHAVAKEVSIPGFRKGKAPADIIKKKYADAVDQKWQKAIADHSFRACQHEARIPILSTKNPITFDMKSHDESGAEMKFTFEREPIVPEIDITKIELKDLPKDDIKEHTIDEAVRQVSFFFAEWTTVEERAAQEKDYVILDIYTVDGESKNKAFDGTRFEVSEKSMSSWMRELVVGMKTGEQKEGISKPDDDATEDEKKEFQEKKVLVELIKIEEAILPELDDAFAAKVGCKTVDEMRTNIRNLLENRSNENRKKAQCENVREELLKHFSFDLPKSLLEDEVEHRLNHSLQHPRFKKEWEEKSDDEKKEHKEIIRKNGEQAVRLFYLCRKVAEDANIKLSVDEITPDKASFLELLLGLRSPHEQAPSQEQQSMEMTRLMLEKAEMHIIDTIESKKG